MDEEIFELHADVPGHDGAYRQGLNMGSTEEYPHDRYLLQDPLVCQKYAQKRDPEAPRCTNPSAYCRFRDGCLIWFVTHDVNRQGE
jgi:hypothetical protein